MNFEVNQIFGFLIKDWKPCEDLHIRSGTLPVWTADFINKSNISISTINFWYQKMISDIKKSAFMSYLVFHKRLVFWTGRPAYNKKDEERMFVSRGSDSQKGKKSSNNQPFTNVSRALQNNLAKYTTPENIFMLRISSSNFARVRKAWF